MQFNILITIDIFLFVIIPLVVIILSKSIKNTYTRLAIILITVIIFLSGYIYGSVFVDIFVANTFFPNDKTVYCPLLNETNCSKRSDCKLLILNMGPGMCTWR